MIAFETDFNTARAGTVHIFVPNDITITLGDTVKLVCSDDFEPWAYLGTVTDYVKPCFPIPPSEVSDCHIFTVRIGDPTSIEPDDEVIE
jgi:hypothetical protein